MRFTSVWSFDERMKLTAGFELERLALDFHGQFPANQYNPSNNAPIVASQLNAAANRLALHASIDTRPTGSTELIVGVRTNRSEFSSARTIDPRASFAWMPVSQLTFTASWGIYHQSADPAFFDRLNTGANKLPELRANMGIVGAQLGEGLRQIRVEGWSKSYRDLVGLTRSYSTISNLHGKAHGADFFLRSATPFGTNSRLTLSLSDSRRTEPNTRQDAPAAFDVTSSVTAVVQKEWKSGWSVGIAIKRATGRPFTDVASAQFDATQNVYVPTYAAPYVGRLPAFNRSDATISKQLPMGANRFAAAYVGINNVLNCTNTFSYTWSGDYSARIPVRSTVNRTFFIGANLVMLASR